MAFSRLLIILEMILATRPLEPGSPSGLFVAAQARRSNAMVRTGGSYFAFSASELLVAALSRG
jgi:hypothetical protein